MTLVNQIREELAELDNLVDRARYYAEPIKHESIDILNRRISSLLTKLEVAVAEGACSYEL